MQESLFNLSKFPLYYLNFTENFMGSLKTHYDKKSDPLNSLYRTPISYPTPLRQNLKHHQIKDSFVFPSSQPTSKSSLSQSQA